MILSMTGYAALSADSPRGRLSLELRSVNSRFLDMQFRVAEDLRSLEPLLRELILARVTRGKLDCRLFVADTALAQTPQHLNAEALAKLKALAEEAARAFPGAGALRLADVLRWPGVVTAPQADEDKMRGAVSALCNRALDELLAAREREGEKLAAAIRGRIATMRSRVDEVAPLVPQSVAAYEARLAEKLREALGSGQEERIRAEIALYAAKVDVDEEITRLQAHFSEIERALQKGGAVGKRLDFLTQELNREANTLAAKAASQAISQAALELKLLTEQIREQAQNIE